MVTNTPIRNRMKKLMLWLGYRYLLNKRTMEMHDLHHPHTNCHTDTMSRKNRRYLTKPRAARMLYTDEADGCRWCMGEWHDD
jgi:hypothetical protein